MDGRNFKSASPGGQIGRGQPRRWLRLGFVVLTGLLAGCGGMGNPLDPQEKISDLNYQQTKDFGFRDLRVTFEELDETRCPIEALCIWPGEARIHLRLRQDGHSPLSLELSTAEPEPKRVDGLKIELLEVNPYPTLTNPFPKTDYVIRLKITEA